MSVPPPPRGMTKEEIRRLIEPREEAIFAEDAVFTPYPEDRKEEKRDPWKALNAVAAVLLFLILVVFQVELFVASAPAGWWNKLTYGALGVVFDVVGMAFWIEGWRERKPWLVFVALAFALVTILAASLSMASGLSVARGEDAARRKTASSLEADIAEISARITLEDRRLDKGDARYRTDANETRASIARLEEEREAKRAELKVEEARLAALPAPPPGLFSAIPAGDRVQRIMEIVFLGLRVVLAVVGEYVTTYLLARRKE